MNEKAIIFIAGIVVMIVFIVGRSIYKNRYGKADLKDALLFDHFLIVTASIYHASSGRSSSGGYRNTRMQVFNLETGQLAGRKILRGYYDIVMVVNGIVWIEPNTLLYRHMIGQDISGIDMHTMETVQNVEDIKKSFNIPAKERFSSMKVDKTTGKIAITSNSGSKHIFDCTAFSADKASKTIVLPAGSDPVRFQQSGNFYFSGIKDSERFNIYYNRNMICAQDSFLRPEIIYASHNPEGSETMVFTHRESLDKTAGYSISFVHSSGTTTEHKLPLKGENSPPLKLRTVGCSNDLLLFASENAKRNRFFAVNKNDGRMVWMEHI